MILIGRNYSPYVRRVAVALHILEIPFTARPRSSLHDQAEIRAINPVGRVPALILDDGEVLIESSAILDYLDELVGPERALLPPRGVERRRALYRIALIVGAVEKVASTIYEVTRRPKEKQYQQWIDDCLSQGRSALQATDEGVAGHAIDCAPDQSTLTTAIGFAFIRNVCPQLVPLGAFPHLDALDARLSEMPAFQLTRADG